MKIFLIVISSFLFLKNAQSQNIEQLYSFALKNIEEANYEEAVRNLERAFYFDKQNTYRQDITIDLAKCYLKTNNYDKALKFYDIAYNLAENDSIKNEIIYQKVFVYILQKEYQYAEVELLSTGKPFTVKQDKHQNLLFGIVYFEQEKYDEAKHYFELCFINEKKAQHQIDSLFNIINRIKPYWPNVSKYMSMLLPGSGQLANGAPKSALNSFVLTFSVLALYAYTAANYTLYDAVISILPWFTRYHRGGYENAFRIAQIKQEEKRNNILIQIIDLYQ